MARTPRLIVPNLPHHILQVGHDRRAVFQDQEDYAAFLRWLREASRLFRVAVHAFVLMPDHWQLLATPTDESGFGAYAAMAWASLRAVFQQAACA